jgi:hypothetical protein
MLLAGDAAGTLFVRRGTVDGLSFGGASLIVALPAPIARVFSTDLNDDGREDLVVATTGPANSALVVLLNNGTTFHSAPPPLRLKRQLRSSTTSPRGSPS